MGIPLEAKHIEEIKLMKPMLVQLPQESKEVD